MNAMLGRGVSHVCTGCGAILGRGESTPCLACAIERNQAREASGGGERACRDCSNVWELAYEADGNTVANDTDTMCPDCGSDAIEPLSAAQRRAERQLEDRS